MSYAGHPANLAEISMVTAHETMIAATSSEIAHGSSPAVIRLARATLPVLMKHLKMMRGLVAEDR